MTTLAPWLQQPPPKIKLDRFKLDLFPFQNSGAAFLAMNRSCLLRDGTGLGKTPQLLAAFNALKRKTPALKLILVCPASLTYQWGEETEKFTTFQHLKYVGSPSERKITLQHFLADPNQDILICNYEIMRKEADLLALTGASYPYIIGFDEGQKLKNPFSKTHKASLVLAKGSKGIKMLTATPVFNNVNDIFGLFRVIEPVLFKSQMDFQNRYTYYKEIRTGRGQRVKMYLGPRNLNELKDIVGPYIFGREVSEVMDQLPKFTFIEHMVDLPDHHRKIYRSIEEEQILIYKDGASSKVQKIAALSYLQQCADDLKLVKEDEEHSHPKIDKIVEIIQENYDQEKLVVYTKFTQSLDILKERLEAEGIETYRIDGRVSQPERAAQKTSWENAPGKAVLLITSAGGAGLNLQAGNTIIFLNYPWSYGEILQIFGRIRRIGTKHDKLFIVNVFANDTIDESIRSKLKSKQQTFVQMFSNHDVSLENASFDSDLLEEVIPNG